MFLRNSILLFLALPALLHSAASSQALDLRDSNNISQNILPRHGTHPQHSHAQPVVELNETEVLEHHSPTPPSYYTIDWEELEHAAERHPGLIVSHALFMGLAFFIALPLGEGVGLLPRHRVDALRDRHRATLVSSCSAWNRDGILLRSFSSWLRCQQLVH